MSLAHLQQLEGGGGGGVDVGEGGLKQWVVWAAS